ncbi:MAG: elongation factor G [Pseudomonadota bacterium]
MAQSPKLNLLRNIGIIAHIDAGKTTLSERILFYSQKIHRMGEVHDGTATMDFMPEEQERGITIVSACTTCEWDGHTVNLIDTPGHVDFTIEVERSLRVLDGAVGVFCAVGGVEPQSETVWRQSEKFSVPKLAFINKIDRLGADFEAVLTSMQEQLGVTVVPLTVPIGQGEDYEALIDLVHMQRLDFDEESHGEDFEITSLTDEDGDLHIEAQEADVDLAATWHERMLETLAENDEIFVDLYLGGEKFTVADVQAAIRRATLARKIIPVFVGSALRNAGVQPLLDGVLAYLPSPLDAEPVHAVLGMPSQTSAGEQTEIIESFDGEDSNTVVISPDSDAPFAGLVFKVIMDGGRKLSLVRIYAGTLSEGDSCLNVTRNVTERISRLYRMDADRRETVDKAYAGDIVAVIGLREAGTGDTLSAPERPLLFENIAAYRPVISMAVEPRNAEESDKLDEVLHRFSLEDPTISVEQDEATGQRIVSGMGELHLEIIMERMKREYNLAPRIGNPQVVYQEAISQEAEGFGEFDRELGDQAHYGHVALRMTPRARDAGNLVTVNLSDETVSQSWPKTALDTWLSAAKQGVLDSLQSGLLRGYPVQDVHVEITALQRRDGSSSPAGYHMAAVAAVKSVMEQAGPVLLEPLMFVEITAPENHIGASIGQLGSRGGRVENMLDKGGMKVVQALAPLSGLFGFSTALRSATQGRAGLIMRFERFDRME